MLDPLGIFERAVAQEGAREFLVEEIIPAEPGLSLLVGRPGLGKSILGLRLVFSIATGTDVLGFRVRRAISGYLTFEGSRHALYERVEIIKRGYPDPGDKLRLGVVDPFRLPGDEAKLGQLLDGCRFVVIDPLKYCVRGNYVQPQDATRFLSALLGVSQQHGVAFLLIHHCRKQNPFALLEPGDIDQVKGAGDFAEAATTVMLLERQRQQHHPRGGFLPVNPDARTLYFAKTRDARRQLDPMNLVFRRSTLSFEVVP